MKHNLYITFTTSLFIILSGVLNAQDYIAVRSNGSSDEFYQVSTGEKFTPIGSNYVKLGYVYRPDFPSKQQWTHCTFSATKSIFDS